MQGRGARFAGANDQESGKALIHGMFIILQLLFSSQYKAFG